MNDDDKNPVIETIKLAACAEAMRVMESLMARAIQAKLLAHRNYSVAVEVKVTERAIVAPN